MLLRLLVGAAYACVTTSFIQVRLCKNVLATRSRLQMSDASEPASLEDIINNIKATPKRISDTTQRIADTTQKITNQIQAAPKQISDRAQIITDKIQATPAEISRNVDQVTKNVKDVTDAVVYFPANVSATVAQTQSNIIETAEDIKKKVNALSPMPFINNAIAVSKNVIDTANDLKEGKITGGVALSKLSKSDKAAAAPKKPARNQEEVYEEVKESFYSTLDLITGFGRGVVETAEKVQKLPDDISKTRDSAVATAAIIQKDIAEKQQQAQEVGKVVWKVVSLEAAKETFERTEKKYQNTVKYISDTKTKLQTDPVSLITGKVKEEKKPKPVAIVPVPKKDDSVFGKIWGAAKATKAGIDNTVATVQSASQGVKGLKERIDKKIAEEEAAAKISKNLAAQDVVKSTKPISSAPPSTPPSTPLSTPPKTPPVTPPTSPSSPSPFVADFTEYLEELGAFRSPASTATDFVPPQGPKEIIVEKRQSTEATAESEPKKGSTSSSSPSSSPSSASASASPPPSSSSTPDGTTSPIIDAKA